MDRFDRETKVALIDVLSRPTQSSSLKLASGATKERGIRFKSDRPARPAFLYTVHSGARDSDTSPLKPLIINQRRQVPGTTLP